MAKERSFWSSIPGVLTGLAGILTAVVGLLGLALSQGWIGDGTAEEEGDGGGGDTEVVRISADPERIDFRNPVGGETTSVAVTNQGTQPVTVSTGREGDGAEAFTIDDGDCTRSQIPSGGECKVEVMFDAGPGQHEATLVISANDDEQVQEVPLSGTSVNPLR